MVKEWGTRGIWDKEWSWWVVVADNWIGLQIFNFQRLAVLTTALTRSPPDADLIFQAMQDKVHQPYRKTLVNIFHLDHLSPTIL